MDPSLFVGEYTELFLCPICLHITEDPIEHTDCDKLFCQSCLTSLYQKDCPHCRGSLTNKTRKMNRNLHVIYERLHMRCVNAGCVTTFPWTLRTEHERQCEFAPKVECPLCHEMIFTHDLENHVNVVCGMFPVTCPVTGCPSCHVESSVPITRNTLKTHFQDFAEQHLVLISQQNETLELNYQQLQEVHAQQATLITETMTQNAALQHEIQILRQQFKKDGSISDKPALSPSGINPIVSFPMIPSAPPLLPTETAGTINDLSEGDKNCIFPSSQQTTDLLEFQRKSQMLSSAPSVEIKSSSVNDLFSYFTATSKTDKNENRRGNPSLKQSHVQLPQQPVSELNPAVVWNNEAEVCVLCVSASEQRIYTGCKDSTIKVLDISQQAKVFGGCISTWFGHQDAVTCLVLSPNTFRLYSGSNDKTIKVWDIRHMNQCLQTLSGHTEFVTALVIDTIGNQLFSASVDKTIKVWDLTNGLLIKTMVGHRRSVRALVLAKPTHVKNNSRLYSASHDHTIIVWDAKTYLWFHTFSAHTNGVFTLALSVNEDFLFSGSADMTIKVWDLKTYRCTATLTGHEASISCLLFSKKTSLLLSGSYDGMMKVWAIDRPTEPLQTFQIHDDVVRDLQIHDNFKMTFSTSKDKTMKLWQL